MHACLLCFTEMLSTNGTSSTKESPIEGQHYTLQCNITGGTPRTAREYEWKRDGEKLAETGATLMIPEVERSKNGNMPTYTCAADNGAGMGEHGTAFTANVWCR